MKKSLIKSLKIAAMALLTVTFIGVKAYAADDTCSDTSGNVFSAGQLVDVRNNTSGEIDNELFAAGMDVCADSLIIDGSAFLAGQNVTIKETTVGGSVFAAGGNVNIDASAKNNIWVAGNSISILKDTKVKGLHAAGNIISVSGEYESVTACGSTVTFNAVVDGDVEIEADKVIIGDDAKVSGNFKIKAAENPDASEITGGVYSFEEAAKDDGDEDADDKAEEFSGKAFGKATVGLILFRKVKRVILNLLRYALLAIVLLFVFKKNMAEAYEYATKKPGAFWGFGALILIIFPLAAIIGCCTIIGVPVAFIATMFYVLALFTAKVFTFASLVRELIFTNTKKRLHPVAEVVLAVLPAAVIKEIPVIGGLVGFACAIYTIGYASLAFYDTISGKNKSSEEAKTE